jgi:hypothetical protein
VSHVVF